MRIRDAIAPYTRFVRGEQEKLEKIEKETTVVIGQIRTLRHKIGGEERAISGVKVRRPVDAPLPTRAISPRSVSSPDQAIEMPAPAPASEPEPELPTEESGFPIDQDPVTGAPGPERKPEAISPDDV